MGHSTQQVETTGDLLEHPGCPRGAGLMGGFKREQGEELSETLSTESSLEGFSKKGSRRMEQ